MRSSNPALNSGVMVGASRSRSLDSSQVMTSHGAVNKTAFLLFLLLCTASYVWSQCFQAAGYGEPAVLVPHRSLSLWMMVGGIGGFIVAIVTSFKPVWAPYTSPVYAMLEGLFLGAISASFEARMPGVVVQASLLTMATLLSLLMAYKSGFIKVTDQFRSGVVAATGGIALVYLLSIGLGFFGISIPYLHEGGPIGIGISLVVVVVAALNLVLDFDFIDQGVRSRAPKYMEWYAGFALLVTLVWLYIEFLKLLSKLKSRD